MGKATSPEGTGTINGVDWRNLLDDALVNDRSSHSSEEQPFNPYAKTTNVCDKVEGECEIRYKEAQKEYDGKSL